jgi:hypothetical protein
MQFDVRIRLTPAHAISDHVRPFAEGVVQSVSQRSPDGDRDLRVDEIDDPSWNSAWAQTRTLERPQEINTIDASGVPLVHLFSDNRYGASFVPFIRDVIDVGAQGALVSIPLAHSVLVHPICDVSLVQAAQAMIPITRQVHQSGPGSLSPHVYWWRDGSLTWIPTYFGRDGVEFHAPNGLADLIADQD